MNQNNLQLWVLRAVCVLSLGLGLNSAIATGQSLTVTPSYGNYFLGGSESIIGGACTTPVTWQDCESGGTTQIPTQAIVTQYNTAGPALWSSCGDAAGFTPWSVTSCTVTPERMFPNQAGFCAPSGAWWDQTGYCTVDFGNGTSQNYTPNRSVACPSPYIAVSNGTNSFTCQLAEESVCPIGDPTSPVSGTKNLSETDYRSGTLEFIRYYYSAGHPNPGDSNLESPLDRWRNNWDRRLTFNTTNPQLLAIAMYPDGKRRHFQSNGAELFNSDGAAAVLTSMAGAGWKVTLPNSDVEQYDLSGFLTSFTTRAGLVTIIGRDSSEHILSVTDSFGHQLTLSYDSSGNLATVQDPAGNLITYGYDTSGRLASVTYPDQMSRSYQYQDPIRAWLLTGIIDESGAQYATDTYDSQGRVATSRHAGGADSYSFSYGTHFGTAVTNVTDPLGTTRTYTIPVVLNVYKLASLTGGPCEGCGNTATTAYDSAGNRASTTDFDGNQTLYTYDSVRNLETSRTEAYGTPRARTISAQWNPLFRLPALITEATRTTSFGYDTTGNLLTRTITDTTTNSSRTWTYTYDAYGRVLSALGPRTDVSDITTYSYYTCASGFQCGRLQNVTDAAGHTTTYNTYNAHGLPLTMTDANGVVTTVTYDSRERLTSVKKGDDITSFSYYPTGVLERTTLSDGSYVQYAYDAAHRLTQLSDGLGNRIAYTLDALGNRTAENVYDAAGSLHRTHSRVFNALNEVYEDINAANTSSATTTYGYDSNGNQTSIAAPLSRNTTNSYDELNRLNQITNPAGGITKFAYDSADNLVSVIDPRTLATSYTYNGFGEQLTQLSADTGTATSSYDSAGNLSKSTDARGATATYAYDQLNRVTSITYKMAGLTDQTISFIYDGGAYGKGRLTGTSDSNQSMSWAYDALGRVTSKSQAVGGVTKSVVYAYTSGNLTGVTTPSGQTVVYAYNSNHQVTSITVNGATVLSGATYEPFGPVNGWVWGNGTRAVRSYNLDGGIYQIASAGTKTLAYDNAQRITSITDNSTGSSNWTYGYDLLDRITSGVGGGKTLGWTYDSNGNRVTETGSAPSTYMISSTSNRITSISGALARTYSYDSAGDVVSYSNVTAAYDGRGRMKSLTTTGKRTSTTESLVYNAVGQVVETTGGIAGTVLYFHDESGHLMGEYSSTGALIEETVWLGDIPVATLRPSGSVIVVYYVHDDHLNTPRQVTRPSDNVQVWRWFSDPFGTDSANPNPAGAGTFAYNLRFPGQVFDGQAGLHYNYFRDFDPAVGRYVESDPIGLKGGINTYAYVKESPLSRIDSLGLYAYGDIVTMWNHYCDGSGTDRSTSFNSINWGDTSNRALAHVMALIGQSCTERTIPVSFNLGAQTAGADQFIIGRHVVKTGGTIGVHCDCTWSFTGNLSSALGYDPFDFDASNRGFIGESLTWIGGHRCPNSGKAFNIYLPGQQSLSSSGTIDGTPTCCRK